MSEQKAVKSDYTPTQNQLTELGFWNMTPLYEVPKGQEVFQFKQSSFWITYKFAENKFYDVYNNELNIKSYDALITYGIIYSIWGSGDVNDIFYNSQGLPIRLPEIVMGQLQKQSVPPICETLDKINSFFVVDIY